MIATVVFFAEKGVLKGIMMGDVGVTVMREGVR